MSNAMKYIKNLEAAGFDRAQAEAQVQMVLDALEGNLATKGDFALLQERLENQIGRVQQQIDSRFTQIEARFTQIDARFSQFDGKLSQVESRFEQRLVETEFRIITRLGVLLVSTVSLTAVVLNWLSKV